MFKFHNYFLEYIFLFAYCYNHVLTQFKNNNTNIIFVNVLCPLNVVVLIIVLLI